MSVGNLYDLCELSHCQDSVTNHGVVPTLCVVDRAHQIVFRGFLGVAGQNMVDESRAGQPIEDLCGTVRRPLSRQWSQEMVPSVLFRFLFVSLTRQVHCSFVSLLRENRRQCCATAHICILLAMPHCRFSSKPQETFELSILSINLWLGSSNPSPRL